MFRDASVSRLHRMSRSKAGIALARGQGMLTHDATHSPSRAPRTPRGRRPVLRWMFERRDSALTAQVDLTPSGTYELRVVPHWDVSRAVVEPCGGPVDALHRHAEIARQLREVGWTRVY